MIRAVNIRTIAVAGAGIMGQGIALVFARAGYSTVLYDLGEELVRKGLSGIQNSLDVALEKSKMTSSERKKIESNLSTCSDISGLKADLVIEAIVEQMETKKSFFQAVERVNSSETVLATNTSSLSVAAMAESLIYPERFLGLHFFNPAQQMKLVEVVSTQYTDRGLEEEMCSLCLKAGKIPVRAKDSPGFIVNRVARHYYVESLRLLEEGQSGVQGIDRLLKSAGFRMGPFELMDMIGIDINFAVTASLHEAFLPNPKFAPSRLQHEMIKAGQLGRKTGKGFYDYEKS